MRINQNISAMNTYSRLTGANNSKSRSLEKLSSGLRINRAGDDAAGLAISEKMRGQVGGLKQAVRNAQDGISLIQTAEGALNETHSILARMRDLAVQSSSDTNTDADRAEIQKEIDQLASEMTRISNTTEFNTKNLLNGQLGETVFHIGANSGQSIELGIGAMDAQTLGVAGKGINAEAKAEGATIAADGVKLGAGVKVNGEITFDFVAKKEAKAGTAEGTLTLANFNKDFSGVNAKTIEINGKTITFDENYDAGGGGTAFTDATLVNHINTALDGVAKIAVDAGKFTITDNGPKGTSSAVTIVDDANLLGTTVTKTNGTDEEAAHVLLGDGKKLEVDADATSFKIAEGNYKGTEITLAAGKTVADLVAADKVGITVTEVKSTAATAGKDAFVAAGIDVSSQTAADAAITIIDEATAVVSEERSKLGSIQNRLDHTINNLTATAENLSAAESRIRDVDMAEEMMEFTKNNILSQAATSMLAQANQMPQSVLQLLQ